MFLSNTESQWTGKKLQLIDDGYRIPDSDRLSEGFGYLPRDYSTQPLGSVEYATPFSLPTIDRALWPELIAMQEKASSRMSDIRKYHKLKSTNQNPLPYCWIHGSVNPMRLLRAKNGLKYADLEPTSAGALIKRYRKSGGNTPEAIKHLAEIGVATTSYWPRNSLSPANDTPAMRANAKLHRITEWWELRSNNFNQLATAILLGYAPTIGLMWWKHMVTALDLVVLGRNEFGIRFWNSWGDGYGEAGEGILTESKATAFDQMVARSVTFSDSDGTKETNASKFYNRLARIFAPSLTTAA